MILACSWLQFSILFIKHIYLLILTCNFVRCLELPKCFPGLDRGACQVSFFFRLVKIG